MLGACGEPHPTISAENPISGVSENALQAPIAENAKEDITQAENSGAPQPSPWPVTDGDAWWEWI